MKLLAKQFGKFTIVGGIAFLIDYGLMVFFTAVCGINYLISTTASFLISIVFNYFASMRYVFLRREDISRHREFITFVILSVIGLILNDILMYIGTGLLGITYLITKIVVGIIVAIWNFFSRRRFLDASVLYDTDEDASDRNAMDGEIDDAEGIMPDGNDNRDVFEEIDVGDIDFEKQESQDV